MANYEIDDAPPLSDYDLKIIDLVLSHDGVRGNSRKSFYFQGMEEERLKSIKNIMQSMNMSPIEAMAALRIPENEYAKYEAAI